MVKYALILVPILALLSCQSGKHIVVEHTVEPLRFIQPRASISMSGNRSAEIPVQLWVERDSENRKLRVTWRGVGCAGSFERELYGAQSESVQPPMKAYNVTMTPGVCHIVAEVLGPGLVTRWRATFDMRICGGGEECVPEVK